MTRGAATPRRTLLLLSASVLSFPEQHPVLATVAGLVTAAKFSLYALAVAAAAAGMLMARASRDGGRTPGGSST